MPGMLRVGREAVIDRCETRDMGDQGIFEEET